MDNYIPRINPILRRKCTEIVDEYAKTLLPEIRYSGITFALAKVSISHGKTRREALRELDNIVTQLFPPVPGVPLPSEELNGVADVMPMPSPSLAATAPYWCGPVELPKY